MLVMVVFFIAFRWIHLSTPLIRLFLLVLILLLMPTLNFLPVCWEKPLLLWPRESRLQTAVFPRRRRHSPKIEPANALYGAASHVQSRIFASKIGPISNRLSTL